MVVSMETLIDQSKENKNIRLASLSFFRMQNIFFPQNEDLYWN